MSYRFKHLFILIPVLFLSHTALAAGAPPPTGPVAEATQSDVILLVVYILLALIFSFMCSVAEAVLLSITPSYIAGLEKTNPKQAGLLKKLKQDNVDRSLAAILTLNTIAHTVGAIGSGAKATIVFGSAWFGLFSAVMTLLILFLSEIIPKTLGALHWRKLSGITAVFVQLLIKSLYPLIIVSEMLTKLISGKKGLHGFNREEFIALADIGAKSGHIKEFESRILKNLFSSDSLKAKDIMTPRIVIKAEPEDSTVSEALANGEFNHFSRIPVYSKDLDDIKSFVLKNDLLLAKAEDKGDDKLSTLARPLKTVPAEATLASLLDFFLNERLHMSIVIGEYGGTQGLVSLEDVVETLLGMEIVDEMDNVTDMQEYARKKWAKRASELGIDTSSVNGESSTQS
jgi:CBS domain containing-hemolysin-like protein